jgi:CHAT domain-containing protein
LARTGSTAPGLRAPVEASVTPPEVQRNLVPGEVLLEYLVTKDRLVIFGVTPQGMVVRQLEEGEASLGSRVQLARGLLQRRDGEASARGVLTTLYDILIQPLLDSGTLQGATRLIVVPHGPLAYLPFAALIDRRTGRYVAERYAVIHLPTASALPRLRRVARSEKAPAGVEVFAPFPDSLAATRAEAEAIRRSIREVRVHLGESATKTSGRSALESGAIVHVATHARLNRRNPLFSAIDLAGRSATRGADGLLEVHELLGLRVRSPLVFLSGCETALGGAWSTRFDTDEDYTTLAQALLSSGAANVVATLWRVDDTGAAKLASHFYLGLRDGPVPEALAGAQRAMLADSQYRSPYYWAAYETSGSGLPVGNANLVSLSDKR